MKKIWVLKLQLLRTSHRAARLWSAYLQHHRYVFERDIPDILPHAIVSHWWCRVSTLSTMGSGYDSVLTDLNKNCRRYQ